MSEPEQTAPLAPERTPLEDIVRPLLATLQTASGFDSTYLTRIDPVGGVQHVDFAHNSQSLRIPEGVSVELRDTLCQRALAESRLHVEDVATQWPDADVALGLGIRAYASAPVRLPDGTLYGTLCAAHGTQHPVTTEAGQALQLFARLLGLYIEQSAQLAHLRAARDSALDEALRDPLTGLPNRRALESAWPGLLRQAVDTGGRVIVGFVDLDDFKSINDRYGHTMGDDLLRGLARRLAGCLRGSDLLVRHGGDEFALALVTQVADEAIEPWLRAYEQRLERAAAGAFTVGETTIDVTGASAGLVVLSHSVQTPLSDALAQADARMYQRKAERQSPDWRKR